MTFGRGAEDYSGMRETSTVIDDSCWKQVMTDSELEDRLFTCLALAPHSERARRPGSQLVQEAERRGKPEMVERARTRAEATPAGPDKIAGGVMAGSSRVGSHRTAAAC